MPQIANLRIDFSSLDTYKLCPQKFWYEAGLGLQPEIKAAPLTFGTWLHTGLAMFHASEQMHPDRKMCEANLEVLTDIAEPPLAEPPPCSLCKALDAIKRTSVERPDLPLEGKHSATHALKLMWEYAARDNFDPHLRFIPRRTEQFLIARVNPWLEYCGYVDMVADDVLFKQPTIVEHKTTFDFRSFDEKARLSAQATGYVWLLQQAHLAAPEHFPDHVSAIVYNGLQTAYDKLEKKPDECFQRISTARADWQIKEWYADLLYWTARLRADLEERGESWNFPQSTPNACFSFNSKCTFYNLCETPPDQRRALAELTFPGRHEWQGIRITWMR